MKIAFFHECYPFGGAEKVSSDVAQYLSTKGHTVYMFVAELREEVLLAADRRNIKFLQLPSSKIEEYENGLFIIRIINEYSIDILVNVVQGRLLPYIADIKRHCNCKVIYSMHNTPLWEVTLRRGIKMQKYVNRSDFKALLWRYVIHPFESLTNRYKREYSAMYRDVYNLCDAYLVLCDGFRDDMHRILKLDPNNNKVVAMTNPQLPRTQCNMDKQHKVLYVGRLSYPDKRVDRLIDVWAKLYLRFPQWELLIVGDGPARASLEQQSACLERVRFCGYTTDPELYYNDAAILALTSTYEGCPLSLCEAQQAGVVPIAFDCSAGVNAIIAPSGVNGVLVPCFDMNMFVSELANMMSNTDLRLQISRNAVVKSEQYALEKVGQMWEELFDKLLN